MKLKLINFQSKRTNETKTCEDCGFVSHISRYELTVEVVSADRHKVGSQHLIHFKKNPYIDMHIVNDEGFWKEFFDENEVPECVSFDEQIWTNCLRKQYQDTIGLKKDKELAEHMSAMLNEIRRNR